MSQFTEGQRRVLRERVNRLFKLIELKAPQMIIESDGALIIRGVIAAVGPGALTQLGKWMVEKEKETRGICPFCPEERPLKPEIAPAGVLWGMCAECLAEAQKDEEEIDRQNAEEAVDA